MMDEWIDLIIAGAGALTLALIAFGAGKSRSRADKATSKTPPAKPPDTSGITDAAKNAIDSAAKVMVEEVDEAAKSDTPAKDLAAIGNARDRTR